MIEFVNFELILLQDLSNNLTWIGNPEKVNAWLQEWKIKLQFLIAGLKQKWIPFF